jgi:hypothetical protein
MKIHLYIVCQGGKKIKGRRISHGQVLMMVEYPGPGMGLGAGLQEGSPMAQLPAKIRGGLGVIQPPEERKLWRCLREES